MKKKIMMGLGALTAVAAPVVGLISCGEDNTFVDDLLNLMPSKVTIKKTGPEIKGLNIKIEELKKVKKTNDPIILKLTDESQANDSDLQKSLRGIIKYYFGNNEDASKKIQKKQSDYFKEDEANVKAGKSAITFTFKPISDFKDDKISFSLSIQSYKASNKEILATKKSKDIMIEFKD